MKFSVILPTYNRAADLIHAIHSVDAQTYRDFDCWVVDDGSTDGTAEALAPYRDSIIYRKQMNKGHAAARNIGILESQGEYLAFLDSDDRWHPSKLARYYEAIQTRPDAGLLYSGVRVVDRSRQLLWWQRPKHIDGDGYPSLLFGNFITMSSAVVKRSAFTDCGLFDEGLRLAPDWDMWIRIARGFPIRHVKGALTEYCSLGADSQTADSSENWSGEYRTVITRALRADSRLSSKQRHRVMAGLHYADGRTSLVQGSRAKAIESLKRSVGFYPAHWRAYLLLAFAYVSGVPFLPAAVRRGLRIPT